jgi:hypothetical protein
LLECFAGCPRDDVLRAVAAIPGCGVEGETFRPTPRPPAIAPAYPSPDDDARRATALRLWNEAIDPRGTIVETYLGSRGLALDADLAGRVIRHHGRLRFDDRHVAGMICLLRDVKSGEGCGAHRTFLEDDGTKIGRKMLGRASGAAIMLDDDVDVTYGLFVSEGVESALAGRAGIVIDGVMTGMRPVWALGSAGAIGEFPVLPGVESLTVLGEGADDKANRKAFEKAATRWAAAGREVRLVQPIAGGDANDIVMRRKPAC